MQAEPLVSRRADGDSPELHCRLVFPEPGAPEADHGSGGNPCGSAFDAQRYLGALRTQVLGRVLLTAGATSSTQVLHCDLQYVAASLSCAQCHDMYKGTTPGTSSCTGCLKPCHGASATDNRRLSLRRRR